MRKLKFNLLVLACVILATHSNAQKGEGTPGNIVVTIEMISVSRADAFELVRQDSSAVWAKVTEMVKSGKAVGEYLVSKSTADQVRAVVECALEFRYPTEFDPAAEGGKDTVLVPVEFETRNLGIWLEVLPTIRGEKVFVEMIPARTSLNQFITYPQSGASPTVQADQPLFRNIRFDMKVLASPGVPLFCGSADFPPSLEGTVADKVILMFLTVTLEPKE